MKSPMEWFGSRKVNNPDEKRKFTNSGAKLAAAAVAAAGLGNALETINHHTHTDAVQSGYAEVQGSHEAGRALYEYYAKGGDVAGGEAYKLKTAALNEFLEQHPGLREMITSMWGAPEVSEEIIIQGTRDRSPLPVSARTEFGVAAPGLPESVFYLEANQNGQIAVREPVDTLADFFPGVAHAGAEYREGAESSTARVTAVSPIERLPDGTMKITTTVEFPNGGTATYDERFDAHFTGTPQGDYQVGQTIPWVQYERIDNGSYVVLDRTYPRG